MAAQSRSEKNWGASLSETWWTADWFKLCQYYGKFWQVCDVVLYGCMVLFIVLCFGVMVQCFSYSKQLSPVGDNKSNPNPNNLLYEFNNNL